MSIYCLAGSKAWDKAKEIEFSHTFVLMPYGEDPEDFDWRLLAGDEPIHILVSGYISSDDLFALSMAMDRDGVNRVLYPKGDGSAWRYLSQRVIERE